MVVKTTYTASAYNNSSILLRLHVCHCGKSRMIETAEQNNTILKVSDDVFFSGADTNCIYRDSVMCTAKKKAALVIISSEVRAHQRKYIRGRRSGSPY